ncbi:MAG: DMT family transporter [Candidatus Eisenbacteria bacterium]
MSAVAFAALASMMFGTADFLGGLASRRAPALLVTLIASVAGFALLVPAAASYGGTPSPIDYAWSVAAGVLGGLGVALLFHVLAIGPVGSVAPIVAVCGVAMPALAGLAFGERPGALPLAGIALATVAIVLVSRTEEEPAHSGGDPPPDKRAPSDAPAGPAHERASTLMLSAVAGFGLGAFLACLSRVPVGAGLWPLIVARLAGTAAVLAVILARRVPIRLGRESWGVSVASGFADSGANLIYLWIVRQHPLSIVGTIVSLSPATVVLLARVVLKERFHRRQIAGLALAALAIVLMTARRG